jgi:hypothetical protein
MPKPPKYPLQPYLDQVTEQKEDALRGLARAEDALRREIEEQARLQAALDATRTERARREKEYWTGMRQGALTVAEMRTRQGHLDALQSDLEDQRLAVESQKRAVRKAERAAEEARETLKTVSNEVRVHEEKKQRWLDELRDEAARREQKQIEEISLAMHERRRREKE